MSEPNPSAGEQLDAPADGTDPPEQRGVDLYDVTGAPDTVPQLGGCLLPRRELHGRRGTLVVDRPAGVVHLLDADDDAETFRYRETRPLAGDPGDLNPPADGSDHVVRAAMESVYDVIAAPWAGTDPDDLPRLRGRGARTRKAASR
jgi:hypothetical protein